MLFTSLMVALADIPMGCAFEPNKTLVWRRSTDTTEGSLTLKVFEKTPERWVVEVRAFDHPKGQPTDPVASAMQALELYPRVHFDPRTRAIEVTNADELAERMGTYLSQRVPPAAQRTPTQQAWLSTVSSPGYYRSTQVQDVQTLLAAGCRTLSSNDHIAKDQVITPFGTPSARKRITQVRRAEDRVVLTHHDEHDVLPYLEGGMQAKGQTMTAAQRQASRGFRWRVETTVDVDTTSGLVQQLSATQTFSGGGQSQQTRWRLDYVPQP